MPYLSLLLFYNNHDCSINPLPAVYIYQEHALVTGVLSGYV